MVGLGSQGETSRHDPAGQHGFAQHNLWTAGQIVANFRKHGMTPPPFSYY
jgi:hypothetical protein